MTSRRTMSLKEFVLEEFNRMLAEEGKDVRIVSEDYKPKLVVDNVVKFQQREE